MKRYTVRKTEYNTYAVIDLHTGHLVAEFLSPRKADDRAANLNRGIS